MPSVDGERLDAMMRKIRGLLSKADHPNTGEPEANLLRSKAETLMKKYRIEESEVIERGGLGADLVTPLFRKVAVCPLDSPYANVYSALIAYAVQHVGARAVLTGYETIDGVYQRMVEVCGYESDLRYCEVLFTNARLLFADRMEPRPDPNLSDMENVYRMRSAGMERIKVAEAMGWVKGGAKVTRLYKKACEARGEDPVLTGQGLSVGAYRQAYIDGFQSEFWTRLYNARNAADAEITGGGLVLANRKERVEEALYQRYPQLRPSTTPATVSKKPAKVRSTRWTKADERRWLQQQTAAAQAGKMAGRKAASEVDVASTTPKRRLDK